MDRERKIENVPDVLHSLYPTIVESEATVTLLRESQMTLPPPIINVDSINCEIQTGDGVRFGEEIYILDRQSEKGPIMYEATKEFQDYLRSQSNQDDGNKQNRVYNIVSNSTTYDEWTHKSINTKRMFYGGSCLAAVCSIVLLCNIFFYQGVSNVPASSWYVERSRWYPRPRKCPVTDLKPPTRLVILSHTAGNPCNDLDGCLQKLRNAQGDSFENLCDIKYNFLIGGDGRVYEGRVFKQREPISDAYFDKALMIAFIGNYDFDTPSQKQFEHLNKTLTYLLKGELSTDYKITAADRIENNTASSGPDPGIKIRSVVSKWDKWTENPQEIFNKQKVLLTLLLNDSKLLN